tara:strand:+ start:388 stop:561 length:174 start_codon:yes stop_codon:yes gene_type:complete
MIAYSSASGGVIFVEETLERKTNSISYKDLVKDEPKQEKKTLFGALFLKKKANKKAA